MSGTKVKNNPWVKEELRVPVCTHDMIVEGETQSLSNPHPRVKQRWQVQPPI